MSEIFTILLQRSVRPERIINCVMEKEERIFGRQNMGKILVAEDELACLKVYAEPLLFGIDKNEPEYVEAKRLLKFFDYFVPVPSEAVPYNSILREFIGGSCFNV